ncbi:NAD(P)/FAD-dependent oxidoreductase [Methanothermobacter wolfeii]|uniref:NAD(P)/FAD-dependent oxidoreductase n=1 Tax=Methanothermobacter wolfeii TaxID=145261 RepID=A0A9E7RV17_METWO|nr:MULTISPECIES: NAD(P)/FAD-dependent oxidoreductase [Methanothermobacter]NLM02700.1 NAD(P)/FAD-dependent oxidoreductase [Methanothermobacter wolfeii]QHN05770.1 NAD(P)/FAD-dependent oxidoreductase [Methanothermobacter sp. THM-1]UXH31917.1 NAD(P)/FAD-dependent oxidoreductase [Methanothermobacter wolfeii]SCM55858.1 Dihydrolipoyl dehydrogenase [Methanothermobacter wolfeii]
MRCAVIGGGPAGRAAAMELAALENEVTLIEKNSIGGTCLNEGCMVVCGLNDVARLLNDAGRLRDLGVLDIDFTPDYPRIAGGVKDVLNKIRHVTEGETREAGVEIIYAEAMVEDGRVIAGDDEIQYDRLIIASGAGPMIPPLDGAENAITYRDILNIPELPEKLVIIGGGVIAAEFAFIFSSFGSEVTVVSRSGFLHDLDPVIRVYVTDKLLDDVNILEDTPTLRMDEFGAETSRGYIEGLPLLATGLKPNSEFLEGFVELGRGGAVLVNDRMETSRKNVYAAGEVTGGPGTTPIARLQGSVAGLNAAGIERRIDYRHIPRSISLGYDVGFIDNRDIDGVEATIPGLAGPGSFWGVPEGKTGLTRVKLAEDGGEASVYSVAPGARIGIAYLSLLMRLGISLYDFDRFIETHPSTDAVYKIMRFLSRY